MIAMGLIAATIVRWPGCRHGLSAGTTRPGKEERTKSIRRRKRRKTNQSPWASQNPISARPKRASKVDLYTLSNGSGIVAKIMTYGGIIRNCASRKKGQSADVVLGFNNLDAYLAVTLSLGHRRALTRTASKRESSPSMTEGLQAGRQ